MTPCVETSWWTTNRQSTSTLLKCHEFDLNLWEIPWPPDKKGTFCLWNQQPHRRSRGQEQRTKKWKPTNVSKHTSIVMPNSNSDMIYNVFVCEMAPVVTTLCCWRCLCFAVGTGSGYPYELMTYITNFLKSLNVSNLPC